MRDPMLEIVTNPVAEARRYVENADEIIDRCAKITENGKRRTENYE